MKKKLLVFLVILVLSLCLVGCGRIMFDQYANPTESPNHKTDALAYDVDYCAEEGTSTETHTSHVYTTSVVEATCETRGYTLHSCVGCDKSYKTDHVAAKGHEYEKEDVKATCTTGSYTLYSCKNCDKSYKENFQPAVGHQYAEEKTAPTCTTRGYTTYTCTECGISYWDKYEDANGHDYEKSTVEATCTTRGYVLYDCKNCETSYKTEYTNTKPHSYVVLESTATCTSPGIVSYECSGCGVGYTEGVDKLDHIPGEAIIEDKVEATCKTEGSYVEIFNCTVCSEEISRKTVTVDKLAHTEVVDAAVAPTCETTGLSEGKHCSVCDEVIVAQTVVDALGHDYEGVVTTNPTCTTEGVKTFTCKNDASHVYTEPVDKLAHTAGEAVVENKVDATCKAEGSYDQVTYCSVCSTEMDRKTVTVDKLAHTEVVDAAVAPTCETTGLSEGKHCSVCGEVLVAQQVVAATGHTEVVDAAVAPTCEATGLSEGKHCSVCGEVLVAQTVVNALGHDYDDGVVTTNPTCTTEGVKTFTCKNDASHTYTAPVDALGHTEVKVDGYAATCGAAGLSDGKVCSECGEVTVAQTEIPATGEHTVVVDEAKDATCEEAGYTEGSHCSVCNKVLVAQREVPALAHPEANREETPAKEATCTETGLTAGEKCGLCGEILVEQQELPMVAHSYKTTVTAPTCTAEGFTTYKCENCDDNYISDKVAMIPHTTVVLEAKDATCTATGLTEGAKCTVCNTVTVEQTVIDALGHNYVEYVCTRCGEDDPDHYFEMSVSDAVAAEDGKKVSVTGTVTAVSDVASAMTFSTKATGKNVTIEDENGHEITIYNLVADVKVGDKIRVSGVMSTYENTREIVQATAEIITEHVCSEFTNATCISLATCVVCGQTKGELADHTYTGVVTTQPTCTEKGVKTYTCSVCDDSYEEEVAANGHSEGNVVVENRVEATCTAAGSYENVVYCTVCKAQISRTPVTVEKLGHTEGETVVENRVEATCTETGSYDNVVYCTVCKAQISRTPVTVEKLAHTEGETVVENRVEATCTETGSYDNVVYCTECEAELSRTKVTVPAIDHKYNDGVVTTQPTCTEKGVKTFTCQNDASHTYTEEVEALGHSYKSVVTKPTCEAEGYTTNTCSECNDTYKSDVTAATGHSYNAGVVTTQPTCTTAGVKTYTCSACGGTKTETVEETGHSYKSTVTAPTCTAAGYTTYKCSKCGDTYTDDNVAALGHSWSTTYTSLSSGADGQHYQTCTRTGCDERNTASHNYTSKVTTAATCTEAGVRTYTCSNCAASYTSTIKAHGHVIKNVAAQAAACETAGWEAYEYCSICDYTTKVEIPAIGHYYGTFKVTTQPTATTPGVITYTCAHCQGTKTEALNEVTYYDSVGTNKYVNHSLDSLTFTGVTQASGTAAINNVTQLIITGGNGEYVNLSGWVGFECEISSFGYYFGDNFYDSVFDVSFMQDTGTDVTNVAGPYAKRFGITVSTQGLTQAGGTSLTFVASLTDGSCVELYSVSLYNPGEQITTATPDTMPEYTSGSTQLTDKDAQGNAYYKTPTGIYYYAVGEYNSATGGLQYATSDTLKITLDTSGANAGIWNVLHNKMKISYYSSVPVKVTATYTDGVSSTNNGGSVITDVIFLEAGEHMFSFLTKNYISAKYAKNLTSLEIQALEGTTAEFILYDITIEATDTISSSYTHTLSNGRYTLGIRLAWGGGISSLVDSQDGNNSISNLINNYDTGRLVQQSYYGTYTGYENVTYGGNKWQYNPVQGGDYAQNPSRLIDFELNAARTSAYVKAQPRDWALNNGEITKSYMENVYTVYTDRIQVDNRFTEWSGFTDNMSRHQELPAFYTLSYLGTYTYYNGTSPWTDAPLTTHTSLGNWAGSDQYWAMKYNNTETWSAWYNGNYGIGLYTPNIDVLHAGRADYNRSTDPSNVATNYTAPLSAIRLTNYKPMEYSYLITTGSVSEIRSTFKTHKDFASNEDLSSAEFGYTSTREAKNPVKGWSFDTFAAGDYGTNQKLFSNYNGSTVTFENNTTATDINQSNGYLVMNNVVQGTPMYLSGWIGYQNTEIRHFAYSIDGGAMVTSSAIDVPANDAVVSDSFGGQYAKRFLYEIPTNGIAVGTHSIAFYVVLANGDVEGISGWAFSVVDTPVVKPIANVIILAGQSNAYGASPITSAMYSAYGTPGAFPNVQIHYNNINIDEPNQLWRQFYWNDDFEPYYVGIGGQYSTHFGPEFGIAQYLTENRPDEQWFIVKYTAAGTYLNGQWLANAGNGADTYGLVADMGGYLSDLMVDYVNSSINSLAANYDVKVHSFMWMQGESDTATSKCASEYQALEQQLVNKVRGAFATYTDDGNGESISFINGGIAAHKPEYSAQGNNWTYSDTVNTGKYNNAKKLYVPTNTNTNVLYRTKNDASYLTAGLYDNTNGALANSMWIDTSTLLSKYEAGNENNENDAAHYYSQSMHNLGIWFAQGMNALITGTTSICDHSAGYAINEMGNIACTSCGFSVLTPHTYVAGTGLQSTLNTDFTTAGVYNYNEEEGFMTITGASTNASDPGLDKVYSLTGALGRYLVVRYRTSDASVGFRFVTWGSPAETGILTLGTNGEWQTILIDLKSAAAERIDIRCNINASANVTTDFSHIVSFTSLEDAEAYLNVANGGTWGDSGSSGDSTCTHAEGYTFDSATGNVVCTACGVAVYAPTTYLAGSDIYTSANNATSTMNNITDNGEYISVTGIGAADSTGLPKSINLAITSLNGQTIQRYIVIRYRTNDSWCFWHLFSGVVSDTAPNGFVGPFTHATNGEWKIEVIDIGAAATSGLLQFWLNWQATSESTTTDISHIASFDDLDDATAYVDHLDFAINGCKVHTFNADVAGAPIGSVECTVCGRLASTVSYQLASGIKVDTDNSDMANITGPNAAGVTVTGMGTGLGGATTKLSLKADSAHGKYLVIAYTTSCTSGLIGVTTDASGAYTHRADLPASEGYRAYCYGDTGTTLDRIELLLNYGGDANTTTTIYGFATFDSLEEAQLYTEYLNSVFGVTA